MDEIIIIIIIINHLIPGIIHGQVGLGSEQPGLVGDGFGLDGLQRSVPAQTNP